MVMNAQVTRGCDLVLPPSGDLYFDCVHLMINSIKFDIEINDDLQWIILYLIKIG